MMTCLILIAAALAEPADSRTPVRIVHRAGRTYIACADGTVSEIVDDQVTRTAAPLTSLSDFVPHPKVGFLAVDLKTNQIAAVSTSLRKTHEVLVRGVREIGVDPNSDRFLATCQWQKSVVVVQVQPLKVLHEVQLPFEPLKAVMIGKNRFLVTDAFRGEATVVDTKDGTHKLLKPLRGHNIRGLLLVDDELVVAHQRVSEIARSDFSDVHWGMLMQNVLTRIPLAKIKAGELRGKTVTIGEAGNGSADPSALVRLPDGRLAVALSGVNEVVVSSLPDSSNAFRFDESSRYPTGARPVHLTMADDQRTLLVANAFDHRITRIRFPSPGVEAEGRTDDGPVAEVSQVGITEEQELSAYQRGQRAFFSGRLAHDGWFSCHSCHSEGHTIGFRADTLGDGSFGAPKLIPSLLGVSQTAPWGWSGNFDALTKQISKSVETTMHGTPDEQTAKDVRTYLESLKPRPAARERSPDGKSIDAPLVLKGKKLFTSKGCVECHKGAIYTSKRVVNVGLNDAVGQTRFNPPSLRSVRHRRVFLHDASANTIDAALQTHLRGLEKKTTKTERDALKAFLLSL